MPFPFSGKREKSGKEEKKPTQCPLSCGDEDLVFPLPREFRAHLPLFPFHSLSFCEPTKSQLSTAASGGGGVTRVLHLAVKVIPVAIELIGRQQVYLAQGLRNTLIGDPKGKRPRLSTSKSLPLMAITFVDHGIG